MRLYFFLV